MRAMPWGVRLLLVYAGLTALAAVGVIFAIFNTLPALPLSAAQAGANTAVDHEKSLLHVTALGASGS